MKKLELVLTQAWQKNAAWLKVLTPLSGLYSVVTHARKSLYHSGKCPIYRAAVPVLVIGNITVGGSGKTPFIITLTKILLKQGINVAVISRGYGGDSTQMPKLVTPTSTPNEVGDEPCLIAQSLHSDGLFLPMAVAPNRGQAIDLLLQNFPETTLIISDDGLQHYALHRDEEWIVVDVARGFGNGKLLPQGFLREPIDRLQDALVIYHDKDMTKYPTKAMAMSLTAGRIEPLMGNHKSPVPSAGTYVHAVSGIGYPKRFFDTLSDQGFLVIPHPFGDHHNFRLEDLVDLINHPIIVTSKDAVKLRHLATQTAHDIFNHIWVLPVEMVLSDGIMEQINHLIVKYQLN